MVTKGVIYGHFASKEDLMLSAIEATRGTTRDYMTMLNDQSRPLRERLADFSRAVATPADEPGSWCCRVCDWANGCITGPVGGLFLQ
jgi:AcrR family transcriptional regulator